MSAPHHPVFAALRQHRSDGPVVVAHRGDSSRFPENTLPAFRAARELGVAMQEFDVRITRDGVLLCIHDETFDRTSDAAQRLGPGALVAQMTHAETSRLDAGAWRHQIHAGHKIPTLAEVLTALLPDCIPLIEQKAGLPDRYIDALRRHDALRHCILQSFDWDFVAAAGKLAPSLALAVLGPTARFPEPDAVAVEAARTLGAGMMHWSDGALRSEDVERIHAAGLLVCTYTTDAEIGWRGGAALGFDAMCTNDPGGMLALRRSGKLRR
ncbi:MAG TPA: glycerophosphodiester phosphodiesterase family protein [Planctomycetota bacterium]